MQTKEKKLSFGMESCSLTPRFYYRVGDNPEKSITIPWYLTLLSIVLTYVYFAN